MSGIWSLTTLCRCCHADGTFKSLDSPHNVDNSVEIYTEMLIKTFGLFLQSPALEVSYTICDVCITQLRDASKFKNQVLQCEEKFREYYNNALLQHMEVKMEKESDDEIDIKPEVKVKAEVVYDDYDVKKESVDTESIDFIYEPENQSNEADATDEIPPIVERSDRDSEYESDDPGPSTKKKLRTEIVDKNCVTTYSRQDFKPSETQSTDNESSRDSLLQIIGDIVIEYDNNQTEVDDENPTIDHVQKPRQIIGARSYKAPKTAAGRRGRKFRARKALLKQQRQDDEATSTSTGSRGPRGKNAQYYREYRARKRAEQEKELLNRTSDPSTTADSSRINAAGSVISKKRKSAAEYQREYRARKKAKRDNILIDSLAVIPSTSTGGFTTTHQSTIVDQLTTAGPSVNPQTTAGSSTSNIDFAKPTRRKTPAEYQREYRARKKYNRSYCTA